MNNLRMLTNDKTVHLRWAKFNPLTRRKIIFGKLHEKIRVENSVSLWLMDKGTRTCGTRTISIIVPTILKILVLTDIYFVMKG